MKLITLLSFFMTFSLFAQDQMIRSIDTITTEGEQLNNSGGMGNGGDRFAIEFLSESKEILEILKSIDSNEYPHLANIDTYLLSSILLEKSFNSSQSKLGFFKVLSKENLVSRSSMECALVYPSIKMVVLKKSCWVTFGGDIGFRKAFVLNILLNLIGETYKDNLPARELLSVLRKKDL